MELQDPRHEVEKMLPAIRPAGGLVITAGSWSVCLQHSAAGKADEIAEPRVLHKLLEKLAQAAEDSWAEVVGHLEGLSHVRVDLVMVSHRTLL